MTNETVPTHPTTLQSPGSRVPDSDIAAPVIPGIDDRYDTYLEHRDRVLAALRFEDVDRIPFLFSGPAYAPLSVDVTIGDLCTKPDVGLQASLDALVKLNEVAEVDGIQATQVGCFPVLLTNQWWSKVRVPGIDIDENELWQVQEEEVMKVEDYDFIIENGLEEYLGVIMPKIQNPDLLATHDAWMAANIPTVAARYRRRGFVPFTGGVVETPFEFLCGGRSLPRFFRDMIRIPDKIEQVMAQGVELWKNIALGATSGIDVPSVWLGSWNTAPHMVAPKLFDRFVWPYFKELAEFLVDNGILAVLHLDSNWDREIHRMLELPDGGRCIVSTDGTTDIRRARQIIGKHHPMLGDVPASVLSVGTPEDVRDYVKRLIEDLGHEGLIMNTGCDMPFNTPQANAEALVLATHEFGHK